jgi:hypothetical protein
MRGAAGHGRGVRIAGYDVVRSVLGLILLSAAALKGQQLATEPVAETSLFTSRWFLICVVEVELFFGLWHRGNGRRATARSLAMACCRAY